MKRLGIDYEIVDYVEIDKYAVKSFNAIHDSNFELQDIQNWDKDLKDIDLIMHGSPCFLKGELVNTNKGMKKIENIKVGDYVKSHDNNYHKVIATMVNKNDKIYDIKCSATHNINTTNNHPFYVLRGNKKDWITSQNLKKSDYLCIPINKKQLDIKWDGIKLNYNNHIELSKKLPFQDYRF